MPPSERRDEADLDARLVRVDVRVVEEQPDVVERPAAVLVLERAEEHRAARAGTGTAIAYAKNGSVASQASERRLRPDVMSGRSACGAASVAIAYAPTFVGHCCAIRFFAFVCWPRLANFTFA